MNWAAFLLIFPGVLIGLLVAGVLIVLWGRLLLWTLDRYGEVAALCVFASPILIIVATWVGLSA